MSLVQTIIGFFLPSSCAYCRSSIGGSRIPHFCSSCWSDFSMLGNPVCPRCGRPFESPEALSSSPEHECRSCRTSPPLFDQALSIGQFEGPLREAIHQFKYRPCRSLGKPLGEWMAERVRLLADIHVVMPVPLHQTRLRTRGFNQAFLLAHCLSQRHGITLSFDNLARIRPTRPQVELSGDERIKNVANAFAVRRWEAVEQKHVLLIDDVFTTGATMNECAGVLKRAGAAHVSVCTLARAV